MKNYIYISAILCGAIVSSCSLDNENLSAVEGNVIYSTPELANSAVMGIHQSFGETNSYRGRFIPYFGVNSDCEIFNNYGGVSDPTTDKEASLACYSALPGNTYMNTANNAYAKMYEAIERANKGISDILQYGDTTNVQMRHLLGELMTLRGMTYYDLVKAWGDVPYRFSPVNNETLYLARTSRVTILKRVLADLDKAENYVYDVNEGYATTTERVSKAFVRGLSARVALFLAGKSYWPENPQISDEYGVHEGGNTYNISNAAVRDSLYRVAYNKCVTCISKHPKKLNELPFLQNFTNLCQDITTPGLESLYEIPFSDGRGRVLYTWGGKHSAADRYTALAKGGVNGPIPTLWYDYDPADKRRDITVIPYIWEATSAKETIEDGSKVAVVQKSVSNLIGGGWSFGKLRFEWMSRRVTSTNDDGINWQVMRLADVYMMAAEAAFRLGDINSAKSWIKYVMDRAYDDADIRLQNINEGNFFDLLVDERKFEFAGEALRKTDLMRWGILTEKMEEAKKNLQAFANRTPGGNGVYDQYPLKVYYNEGLDAAKIFQEEYKSQHPDYLKADSIEYCKNIYSIYGLDKGDTDVEGKAAKYANSSYVFTLNSDKEADKTKVQKYIDSFYINDPNLKMFWPIWTVFINSSNGQLKNYYGYTE